MQTFLGHEEVFWSGVQAICAVFALLGLGFYVYDTRRMAKTQEESRKTALTPNLVGNYKGSSGNFEGKIRDELFEVTNVGGGVAIHVIYWDQRVPKNYTLTNEVEVRETGGLASIAGQLLSGQTITVQFERIWIGEPTLFVISAYDALHGIHQLKFHREPGYNGITNKWGAKREYRKPRLVRTKQAGSWLWARMQEHDKWLESQMDLNKGDD